MKSNLLKIQKDYLRELFDQPVVDLEQSIPAKRKGETFHFKAFGEPCSVSPDGITLKGELLTDPRGILIALYFRNTSRETVQLDPVKSFKQIEGSMPYESAFRIRAEESLVPWVRDIQRCRTRLAGILDGHENEGRGDFSLTLYPLPKVPLYYIFYLADDEFPAAVTCLFAANAQLFMPVDGLADVGEYTAKKIIEIVHS